MQYVTWHMCNIQVNLTWSLFEDARSSIYWL